MSTRLKQAKQVFPFNQAKCKVIYRPNRASKVIAGMIRSTTRGNPSWMESTGSAVQNHGLLGPDFGFGKYPIKIPLPGPPCLTETVWPGCPPHWGNASPWTAWASEEAGESWARCSRLGARTGRASPKWLPKISSRWKVDGVDEEIHFGASNQKTLIDCRVLDLGIHQRHCVSQGKQYPCREIPGCHFAHPLSPPRFGEDLSGSMKWLKNASCYYVWLEPSSKYDIINYWTFPLEVPRRFMNMKAWCPESSLFNPPRNVTGRLSSNLGRQMHWCKQLVEKKHESVPLGWV